MQRTFYPMSKDRLLCPKFEPNTSPPMPWHSTPSYPPFFIPKLPLPPPPYPLCNLKKHPTNTKQRKNQRAKISHNRIGYCTKRRSTDSPSLSHVLIWLNWPKIAYFFLTILEFSHDLIEFDHILITGSNRTLWYQIYSSQELVPDPSASFQKHGLKTHPLNI